VIPLKDDIPSQRRALVTVGLILANLVVFLAGLALVFVLRRRRPARL
jgi:hypothetical protein